MICDLTGGKRTPGSGNKSIKGDVRIWANNNALIEAKQTSKPYMDIKADWLEKAHEEARGRPVALVIAFELRGYVYYHNNMPNFDAPDWKVMRVKEKELPEVIYHSSGNWELDTFQSLRNFKKA